MQTSNWGSLAAVSRILKSSETVALKVARAGHVRTRQLPGCWIQYDLDDAARVAAEAEAASAADATTTRLAS